MKANDRLAKIIALGKKRYILLHGMLGWGLLTASLVTIWSFYTKEKMTTAEVIIPFVVFPIGGIFWGAWMWSIMKKKYSAVLEQNSR